MDLTTDKFYHSVVLLLIGIVILLATVTYLFYLFKFEKDYSEYKACVINLARRRDRMLDFGRHYNLPVKYEIIDAVDGRTLDAN